LTFYVFFQKFEIKMNASLVNLFARPAQDTAACLTKPPRYKCGISKAHFEKHFSFKCLAANVVGPKICLEDNVLMSGVKRGQSCLANGKTEVLDTNYVDIQGGDVAPCKQFLKAIPNGTTVLMGTSDDGVTKLNDEAQGLLLN
jgi:hypothetical protein